MIKQYPEHSHQLEIKWKIFMKKIQIIHAEHE